MATFGSTTPGGSSSTSGADKTSVSQATPSSTGDITTAQAYLWLSGAAGSTNIKFAIYANNSGTPGTLLAQSGVITLSSTTPAWRTFTFSGANLITVTAGTSYWIGPVWQDADPSGSSRSVNFGRTGTGLLRREGTITWPTITSPTWASPQTGVMDAFVTYTPAAATVTGTISVNLGALDLDAEGTASTPGDTTPPVVATVGTPTAYDSSWTTIARPGTPVSGDIVLLLMKIEHNGGRGALGPVDPPSGFTSAPSAPAYQDVDSGVAAYVWWKVSAGSEPSTYTVSGMEARPRRGIALRITGADTASPWDATVSEIGLDRGDIPSVDITTTGDDRLVVWFGASYQPGSTWSMPDGFTRITQLGTGSIEWAAGQRTVATASDLLDLFSDVGGGGGKATWTGAIKPAPTSDTVTGTVDIDLGALSLSAAGTVTPELVTATVDVDLGALSLSAAGTVIPELVTGTASLDLGGLSLAAAGTVIPELVTGTVDVDLGALALTATGVASVPITGEAVRFDEASDRVTYAGAMPSTAAGFTATCWVYLSVDRGDYSAFFRLWNAGGTVATIETIDDGTTPGYFTAGGSALSAVPLSVGAWHRLAVSASGGTANVYSATPTGTVDLASGSVSTGTPTGITVGGRHPDDDTESFNGRVSCLRVWSTVLDQAEIEAEWASWVPVVTDGLHADWLLGGADDLADHSGNGRNLAPGTTAVSTEDGPPIGGAQPQLVTATASINLGAFELVAAGAVTPELVSGTVSVDLGALSVVVSGTVTPELVTGTASFDLGALTLTASGHAVPELVTGTVDVPLGGLVLSAVGTVVPTTVVTGTVAIELGGLVLSVVGVILGTPSANLHAGTPIIVGLHAGLPTVVNGLHAGEPTIAGLHAGAPTTLGLHTGEPALN